MHGRTAILLFLVVVALAAGVRWQLQREEAALIPTDRAFVSDVELLRVDRIRIDNLERSIQLTLERDERGAWQIVDPIAYPASAGAVRQLLEVLTSQRAFPVRDPDLEGLSLAPPRAVLEIEQEIAGERVRNRIELGAVDLDGQHGFALVDGTVVRTLRTLDSILARGLPEWRSAALFSGITPYSVTEVHRRGSASLGGEEPEDLTLDLVHDGVWRATAPWQAQLDPGAVGLLISGALFLRTTTFTDDAPADLSYYGLDPAPMTLSFTLADSRTETLRLAPHPDGGDWYCVVEGVPHIYRVHPNAALILLAPLDALVSRDILRAVRERISGVRFASAGREVTLEPVPGGWVVSGRTDAGIELDRERADRGRVEDLIGELERERVLQFLPDQTFPEGPTQGLWIEAEGHTQGGSIGPVHVTGVGGSGVLFQRTGDGLVSLVDARLLDLVGTDPGSLRSTVLVDVSELGVARVELTSAAGSQVYMRNSKGRWSLAGTEVEARTFAASVDKVLSLHAVEHLPSTDSYTPLDPVTVLITRTSGGEVAYTLDGTAGEAGLYVSGSGAALVDATLWRALSELLTAE